MVGWSLADSGVLSEAGPLTPWTVNISHWGSPVQGWGLTLLVGPELAHGKRGPQTAKTACLRGQRDGSGTCPWPASGLCLCGFLLALELQSCPTRTYLCPPPTQLEAQALWVTVSAGAARGSWGAGRETGPQGPFTASPHQVCTGPAGDSACPRPSAQGSRMRPTQASSSLFRTAPTAVAP